MKDLEKVLCIEQLELPRNKEAQIYKSVPFYLLTPK